MRAADDDGQPMANEPEDDRSMMAIVSWTSWVCGEWCTGGMALIKIPPTLPHEENYPSCGSVGGIIDSLVATKQF